MDDFEDDSGTIFRDVTLLALAAFVAMVIMLLPFINPGAEAELDNTSLTDPGNVIVELLWPPELDTDIDLWVKAPHAVPVGFANKGNEIVNLLRDDLGRFQDLTDINYEIVYSRGIVQGEWVVNVQAYRLEDPFRSDPIPVKVIVSVKGEGDERAAPILEKTVELRFWREELTVFRFSLTDKGALVHDSVNDINRSLIKEFAESQKLPGESADDG
jgi:hypothetical protein